MKKQSLKKQSRGVAASSVLGVCLLLPACKKDAPPEPSSITAAATQPAASSSAAKPAEPEQKEPLMQPPPGKLGITWEDPPEWKRFQPRSSVRAANYSVPLAKGDEGMAEVTVFYFGAGKGGTVESNIKRWVGQFSDVKESDILRSTEQANGLTEHVVEVKSGSYGPDMMMMGGPHGGDMPKKEGQGMIGAVIESPTGLYFFKMTGPAKTVAAARAPFMKLLQSMKPVAL